MKRINIIIITILIAIGILFVATTKNYAVESQNNTTNTTVSTTKSSNTILTSLGIRPYDFTGFKNANTTYNVTVPQNVESVEVYATTQNPKATLQGTGTKTLSMGKNVATVTVTAEDGTTKTFTINIIREEEGTSTLTEGGVTTDQNQVQNTNGLKELSIKDASLSPEFQTGVYEYSVKYIGEATQLEFTAQPTDDTYIVEITGNEDLQEGENTVTILVSQSDGNNVATYQLTINKSLVDEEAIAREQAEKEAKKKKTIIGIVIAVIILAIIIFVIVKRKRNSRNSYYDEDDNDDMDFSVYKNNYDDDYNSDYDDDDDDEMPRALRHKENKQNTKKYNDKKYRKQFYDEEELDSEDDEEDNEDDEEDFNRMPKDKIKERFLNNYNSYEEKYMDENIRKRKPPKGKRFK